MTSTIKPLTFGKFKGKTIEEVIEIEPSYIVWLHSKNLITVDEKTLHRAKVAKREDYLERLAFSCRHENAGDRD